MLDFIAVSDIDNSSNINSCISNICNQLQKCCIKNSRSNMIFSDSVTIINQ